MMEMQVFTWAAMSIIGGLFAYFILTEGKNNFLFFISFLFNMLLGISTGYIWLQFTRGLQIYSWALFVLPLIISSVGTILFLSYYKEYHPSSAFPRVPSFSVGKAGSLVGIVVIAFLSILLASSSFPSTATSPSIATFGSSGSKILSADDVTDTSGYFEGIKSSDIMIQKGVITPTSLRDEPYAGENMDFKVELTPSYTLISPSLKVFVEDRKGDLIPSADIVSYQTASNILEGQINCGEPGTYTIVAVLYDTSVSTTVPVTSNSLSYTVAEPFGITQPVDIFAFYMVILCIIIVAFIFSVAMYKKFS